MNNDAPDSVPLGVPDPGTGGATSFENIEESIRLPSSADITPAPGSFAAKLATTLGLAEDAMTVEKKKIEVERGAETVAGKAVESMENASDSLASATQTTGAARVGDTISNIAKSSSDSTTSLPSDTGKGIMDSIAGFASKVHDTITPQSVKDMESKVGEEMGEMSGSMRQGARTGADVPMPSTSDPKAELARQQASSSGRD